MGNLFTNKKEKIEKIEKVFDLNEIIDKALDKLSDDISNIVKSYLRKTQYTTIKTSNIIGDRYYNGCKLCFNRHIYTNFYYISGTHGYNRIISIITLLKETKTVMLRSKEFKRIIDQYPDHLYVRPPPYDIDIVPFVANLLITYCLNCEMLLFDIQADCVDHDISDIYIIDSFQFGSGPVTKGTLLFPHNSIEDLLKDINTGYLTFTLSKITNCNIYKDKTPYLNFIKLKEKNLLLQYN